MNVTIELRYGPNRDLIVTKEGIQRTIDAMARAIAKSDMHDSTLLTDAKSILIVIQSQLPAARNTPIHATFLA